MEAIVQYRYGSPDVLELRNIDRPTIGDDGVLVRVVAASLHIGDWHVMTGSPYMLRLVGFGLRAPRVPVRGIDVAGTVEAVGPRVTRFQVGDDVFGTCDGAFAEYASARQDMLAHKPANLSFDQAAAVPTSSFAALQALRDRGEIRPGQRVLIVGASGGVGIFAVQIAKALGAEVTAVCSAAKAGTVRAIGADHVIDYALEDFSRSGHQYDVILDVGGGRSLSELRRALTPRGILVLVGGERGGRFLGGTGKWIQALLISPFVRQKLRPLSTTPKGTDLAFVTELIESGKMRPVIDRTFALRDVPEAFRYLKAGRNHGKVVIQLHQSGS
jgi:NADPH:quinone reductase-like Zn-dependent oxidoreductase